MLWAQYLYGLKKVGQFLHPLSWYGTFQGVERKHGPFCTLNYKQTDGAESARHEILHSVNFHSWLLVYYLFEALKMAYTFYFHRIIKYVWSIWLAIGFPTSSLFSLYVTRWSLGFHYFTGFLQFWYMLNAISFIWFFFLNLYTLCRIRQFLMWNFMQLNLFCMPDLSFLLLLAFAHSIIFVSLVRLPIPYLVSSRNFINVHLLPDS